MEMLFLDLAGQFLLAFDGQGRVVDGDLDIFTRHVGQLCLQDELFVVVLKDVNRWQPGAGRHQRLVSSRARMTVGIAEHATDAILKLREFPEMDPNERWP